MIRYFRSLLGALARLHRVPAELARVDQRVAPLARAVVELQQRLDASERQLGELLGRLDRNTAELQRRLDTLEDDTPRALHQLRLRFETEQRQLRSDWQATLFTQQQALLAAARALAVAPDGSTPAAEAGAALPVLPALSSCSADAGRTHPGRILLPEALDARARSGRAAWLDVACGAGSWLRELADAGVQARGVDRRAQRVAVAQAGGLVAQAGDECHAVETAEPDSLAGISAFDFIERLAPAQVGRFLDAAWRALAPGGVLMLSGANPENLGVALLGLAHDPQRTRLWLPDVVGEITRACGYTQQRVLRWRSAADGTPGLIDEAAATATDDARDACPSAAPADAAHFIASAADAPDHWLVISRKSA